MWTAIKRAIHIDLPKKNYNFFGLEPSISINIIRSEEEHTSSILKIEIKTFVEYVKTASTLRLKENRWTVLEGFALVVGSPALPLPGKSYWKKGNFIFPTGYDLEFPLLQNAIDVKINPSRSLDILWSEDGTYSSIPKENFGDLSRSSVAKTIESLDIKLSFENGS